MGKSVSFDIAALILLIVLVVSRTSSKMTHDRSNRVFLGIILVSVASTVFDIASVILDGKQAVSLSLLYVAHTGYLITHIMTVPLCLLFIISLTDTWHKLRKNPLLCVVMSLPLTAVLAAFAVNPFNNIMFSVEGGYARGPMFWLMYAVTALYVVFVIVYIVYYHKLFGFANIVAVVAVIPIDLAAMLIQLFFPSALIEMFFGAIGLLIMSLGLQRPEDYVDTFTNLMKFSAYAHDMKRSFYNNKHMYIIMLNIANFQKISSMIDFNATTDVLKKVADTIRRINKKTRGYADLYYLDSGRFRMVFREENHDKAESMAELLNQELKNQISIRGLNIGLMPFIILARCPEEIHDFKALMSFGMDFHERNYYTGQVMVAGRLYDEKQLDIQNNIDVIIERALDRGSFQVYYQPIYSTERGKIVAAEALLRLYDPRLGFISPQILVAAAEKSGAIHRIGEFVFEKVCRFIASDEFGELGLDYIEVNLSVVQLMNVDLSDTLLSVMKKYGVSPDRINLEITESVMAYEQKVMKENLERLVGAGLSFSLDDYGTGYSNMKRVIQLPLRIVKLDKSFVDEIKNSKMWIVIKNTVKMLKDMNMEIVVEGIETQEALDAFSDLKCDFIQGYFFSKPIPKKDFVTYISNVNGGA
ncbi:MAG: EAL domain-containing protein [Butyrivibrio sp.]|nr:EAL domain-containing protein [Butyrivibrio sp.]